MQLDKYLLNISCMHLARTNKVPELKELKATGRRTGQELGPCRRAPMAVCVQHRQ